MWPRRRWGPSWKLVDVMALRYRAWTSLALSQARRSATSGCNLWGPRYAWRVDYRALVTIDPGKRGGKPCIRGLRITVYDVLEYLASGMSEAEILADFPDLTSDDIRACLAFAADRERRLLSVPAA
jgi:uncharacterized protein (DUF433 family)